MSEPRTVVLLAAVGMTALVFNSTVAYVAGREPAIFNGLAFLVLLFGWGVCWLVVGIAARDYRAELRERAEDYRIALTVYEWGLRDSGSVQRPIQD